MNSPRLRRLPSTSKPPTLGPAQRPPMMRSHEYLESFARRRSTQRVTCVQIGANDGVTNDPVHAFFRNKGWYGLVIEPLPNVFASDLLPVYRDYPRVQCANVAIAPEVGVRDLFTISFSTARWATGLSSFDVGHLQRHIDSGYVLQRALAEGIEPPRDQGAWIATVPVATAPLGHLLDKFQIDQVDVLCIDTEGYDFEILQQLDLMAFRPNVILFESQNLTPDEYAKCVRMLESFGYTVRWCFADSLAYLTAMPRLDRVRFALRRLPGGVARRLAAMRGGRTSLPAATPGAGAGHA